MEWRKGFRHPIQNSGTNRARRYQRQPPDLRATWYYWAASAVVSIALAVHRDPSAARRWVRPAVKVRRIDNRETRLIISLKPFPIAQTPIKGKGQ